MKRIFILILFFTTTFNLSGQINSPTTAQGINCNFTTGYVPLDANSDSTEWYYNENGTWLPA
ncbi:MAG: hypothetical protein HON40_03255, partial [Flavobacteriales bacterium]|nr:hypothetical protein [Flavobacteriales bacterium]